MPQLLEGAQLAQRDAVAQVQVGRGGVDAEVDAQGAIVAQGFGQALAQFALHGGARLGVAEAGAAHDQRVLALDLGALGGAEGRAGAGHAGPREPMAARAARQSRASCARSASTPSNLTSPRSRVTRSMRRSRP